MVMVSELILAGGGGHASVIKEAAMAAGWHVAGYYDDRKSSFTGPALMGSHCGVTETSNSLVDAMPWLGRFRGFLKQQGSNRKLILAIGCLATRRELIDLYTGPLAKVIHPTALISETAEVGIGTFVSAAAIVNPYSEIASHAIVNTRAIVEHHCQIEENCHIAPGAVLGGGVYVGADTLIGISASVNPNVQVGRNCIVGAGAVVTNDVADGTTVVGVPAKPLRRLRKSA